MSITDWKDYFDRKADLHGASVKTADYFDDASFFRQRHSILAWLGKPTGKEILDAGCGVGAFSEPLVAANAVHGVDFSEKSLQFAAARGLITTPGDLAALPFADGRFDLVLCIGVLQLLADYRPVLAELARVTRPGGTLVVQTLHRGSLQRRILGLWEKRKKFERMYGLGELAAAFGSYGFADIGFLKQYHPLPFAATGSGSGPADLFCTSFAVKGSKKL